MKKEICDHIKYKRAFLSHSLVTFLRTLKYYGAGTTNQRQGGGGAKYTDIKHVPSLSLGTLVSFDSTAIF